MGRDRFAPAGDVPSPEASREAPLVRVVLWVPGVWWVVRDSGPRWGFLPLEGPFGSRAAAEAALLERSHP